MAIARLDTAKREPLSGQSPGPSSRPSHRRWKQRCSPAGLHLFDRTTDLNVLLDEVPVPASLWSRAPRQVSIALTNRCDLACAHCYAPKSGDELPYELITRWLAELDAHGTLGVGFGGGEPTLYPRFVELCRHAARETHLSVTFTTHGHHIDEAMADGLRDSVHFVRVSMDGVGHTYEAIRRRSFQDIFARVKIVRTIARFGVNLVVNEHTLPDLDEAAVIAADLERVADGIRDGDLDLLRDELSRRPRALRPDVATAPRRLRAGNHLASLHVTNAVGGCREALRLLEGVEEAFASRLVAVLAPAGCGKTQLAAQLTVGEDARPHGVLLHGRDLHANQSLDALARRVSIAAHPVPGMEALLAAVDAAGQRARRRLPVVIGGLNEAEDPRAWKALLGALESTLAKYPYVLLVCTLRPGFETEALPERSRQLEIPHYGGDAIEAIRRHFNHYKIDATDAQLPLGLLQHPLTLRLFCEVTNPTRAKVVSIDAIPGSLTALFDRYLDQVGDRIAELGWRAATFEALDGRIVEDAEGRGHRPHAERYGKKYGWIGFTYAGVLETQGLLPDDGRRLSDVDLDPSFPEPPPVDGEPAVPQAWLTPSIESHERWVRGSRIRVSPRLLVRERLGEHQGPWVAVHGFVKASDRVLGREARASLSALVTRQQEVPDLVAALNAGQRPWVTRDVPSDHYTLAGEIPWHPSFAAEAVAESGPEHAYRERVRDSDAEVEVLAHQYAWESYHSEMNQAGSARVPSRCFSARFDLRSVPQGFDQCLPDGTRATITLGGVDGLEGDVLYVREDLLRQYVGDRAILWFAFGERALRPYPRPPPQWLVDVQRAQANAWRAVLTEADLKPQSPKQSAKKRAGKRRPITTSKAKKPPAKKATGAQRKS